MDLKRKRCLPDKDDKRRKIFALNVPTPTYHFATFTFHAVDYDYDAYGSSNVRYELVATERSF